MPKGAPKWLQTATVHFPSGRSARELCANDAAHLVWAVNLGVIDFNPWPTRRDDLDHPDELRVDLDPTPRSPGTRRGRWPEVVRDVLDQAPTLCRLCEDLRVARASTSTCRIEPQHDFTDVGGPRWPWPARSSAVPKLATSKWWKEERHGVFVDYNQNARDRTVASAYSVRPVPDARVSCPLEWDEVSSTSTRRSSASTRSRPGSRRSAIPSADIDAHSGSLESLLELAARDGTGGLGDAPWPPHFAKQRGEPKRVQPSRAKKRA